MAADLKRRARPISDWVIAQDWPSYSAEEHAVWDALFARQIEIISARTVPAFVEGLKILGMTKAGIPDFVELNIRLMQATGWHVVAVSGPVPDEVFLEHLANRRFVARSFIRGPEQLDGLAEPDVFQDVFGHVPLLAHPVFADYLQALGEAGLRAVERGMIDEIFRLYWHTVEFGLIRDHMGFRIYGASIVSSYGESIFALDGVSPNRIGFDLDRILRTRYRPDDFQPNYFVIDSFEDLLRQMRDADFGAIFDALSDLPAIDAGKLLPSDHGLCLGGQTRAAAKPVPIAASLSP